MVRLSLGVLLCGAAFASGSASASPARAGAQAGLTLRLRAPAGCPPVAVLRGLVAEHLGEGAADAPALRVDLVVWQAGPARWLARIEVRGAAAGRRELDGATCREVIDAAALVIALAVEEDGHVAGQPLPMVLEGEPELAGRPGAALEAEEPGGASRTEASDRGASGNRGGSGNRGASADRVLGDRDTLGDRAALGDAEPAGGATLASAGVRDGAGDYDYDFDAAPARPPAPRRHRLGGSVRAGGAGAAGTLPGAAAGVDAALALWSGRGRLELSGAYWPARAARVGPGQAGAMVGLWTSAVRGCREFSVVGLCGGGELGRMTGRAMELPERRDGAAWWGALSGSIWLRQPIGRAALYAGIEGLVPVLRPRFELDDETVLYRPSALAGRALFGLELDLF